MSSYAALAEVAKVCPFMQKGSAPTSGVAAELPAPKLGGGPVQPRPAAGAPVAPVAPSLAQPKKANPSVSGADTRCDGCQLAVAVDHPCAAERD